jgi:mannose-1-phosphate guanylyltransferase/phosphomannomutase
VKRTKCSSRSLAEAGSDRQVRLTAAMDGRFAFPSFQPHFDALFTTAKLLELLARTGQSIGGIRRALPRRAYRHLQVPCSWEIKGGLMRRMSEHSVDLQATFIDGVKVQIEDDWVLVLPDQYRPVVHIVAESVAAGRADTLLETYRKLVNQWKKELVEA